MGFSFDGKPLSDQLRFAPRFIRNTLAVLAVLAWPWVTLFLLSKAALDVYHDLAPMEYGFLFYAQGLVSLVVLLTEAILHWGIGATEGGRAGIIRWLKVMLAMSGVFMAFTIWFNGLSVAGGIAPLVAKYGLALCASYALLVVAPPVFWFGLNVWRWRNLPSRHP